ncbi:MAG: right-handed parallel beta-helix repeat-containing protein, partial [Promethearchaeota archaeon]
SEPYNYTFSNINSSFNNGNGITFNHIQNSIIFNSEIHNNSKNGISIYNSPYITLVSNDVFNNGNKSDYYNDYGISLYAESNECNLTLNKVFSNENGISIDSVNKSILSLNFIYDNIGNGIEISYSAGNIIDNNIIWHNRDYGITGYYWFESGDPIPENNIIKLNDFIGNRYQTAEFYQAYCDGLCYEFDHNFWDNYRVPDDDKDGIVDYKLKVGRLGQSNYYDEYNYDENPETEPNNDYSSIHYLTSPIITSPTSWDPANPDDWSRTQINGTITIRWLESLDTENHKVTYSLYYLQLGFGWDEQNWTEISSGLTITSYDWDTTNVIDGQYYLMINATCSHGLNSFYKEEWGEFEINNSPPVLTDAYASFPPFILFLIFVLTLGTIKKYQRKP